MTQVCVCCRLFYAAYGILFHADREDVYRGKAMFGDVRHRIVCPLQR